MRETHLLALQKKEKLFLALSLAAVVLCTVLAFGFAVPLQATEPQVLPDTTGLEQYVLVDLNTADFSALCTLPGVGENASSGPAKEGKTLSCAVAGGGGFVHSAGL